MIESSTALCDLTTKIARKSTWFEFPAQKSEQVYQMYKYLPHPENFLLDLSKDSISNFYKVWMLWLLRRIRAQYAEARCYPPKKGD